MCLKCKWNRRPKTAKEDIVCYKYLENVGNNLQTPYFYSIVEIGKTYTSQLKKDINEYDESFLNYFKSFYINEGLHSFKNPSDCRRDGYTDSVYVKCIIPKGSTYYTGNYNGEGYASDILTYVEIIPTPESTPAFITFC